MAKMETKREARPVRPGKRRQFTEEFKAGAVRLVLDEGKTLAQVARDLGVTASVLRTWVTC
jgi:transposase